MDKFNDDPSDIMEKVLIWSNIINARKIANPILANLYTRYAELLAANGRLDVALKYLENISEANETVQELIDRIKKSLGLSTDKTSDIKKKKSKSARSTLEDADNSSKNVINSGPVNVNSRSSNLNQNPGVLSISSNSNTTTGSRGINNNPQKKKDSIPSMISNTVNPGIISTKVPPKPTASNSSQFTQPIPNKTKKKCYP